LHKRENYRKSFDDFNFNKIKQYNQNKIDELMQNSGIVRNKLKILSTIQNAKMLLKIQKELCSFDKYIWQFVNYKTINNNVKSIS
jgi:DNA-3-methyladenine glycosylase I